MQRLILAIFLVYGLVLGTRFYEPPRCTDSDILFLFLLTNVLIVSHFG